MVVDSSIDARMVGVRLLQLLERDADVVEIRSQTQPDRVVIWVITRATDLDAERRIVHAWMPVYDEFPSHNIDLRLLNPSHFPREVDVRAALPADAKPVSSA